jgi:hypothetical protein
LACRVVAEGGVEFGYTLIANLDAAIVAAAEHLIGQVAAFAAETTTKIFVQLVEIIGGILFGDVGFDPSPGGIGIDALGAALGVGDGIVNGDGEGIPVAFTIIEDHVGGVFGLADGEAGNFADFLAVDEEQSVIGRNGDGVVEDGVVEEAIGADGGRRRRRGRGIGFAGHRVTSGRVWA